MPSDLATLCGRPPRGPLRWRWLNSAAGAIIKARKLVSASDNIEIIDHADGVIVRNTDSRSITAAGELPDAFDPYQDGSGQWTITSGNFDFNEDQRTVADGQLLIDGEYLTINSSPVSIFGSTLHVLGIYFRLKFLDPFYTDAPAHVSDPIGWTGAFGTHMELYNGDDPELRALTQGQLQALRAAQVDTAALGTAQRIGEYFIPLALVASGKKRRLFADSSFVINVSIGFGNYSFS